MTFYTYDYLQAQQHVTQWVVALGLVLLLLGTLVGAWRYFRQRYRTRSRDLSIIMVLLMAILLGIQWEHYLTSRTTAAQSSQLLPFIQAVAVDHHLKPDQVLVNSTTLADGMIIRFQKRDYQVHLNADNNSYTLTRAHVINHQVLVKDVEVKK